MNTYTIDLTLQPTTFDLWHVCMAGTIGVLALALISTLIALAISLVRVSKKTPPVIVPAEPEIKIVEKIVEVEKVVEVEKIVEIEKPAPAPVVLKEATSDAALQLLSLLQSQARFIDFIEEDVTVHGDAEVGMVARVVHEGCRKVLQEHFTFAPIRSEAEGSKVTLPAGFNADAVRLTGNIVGSAPFTGTLIHKGWQVSEVRLPKLTQSHNANIIAAAEVEL
jgi:hypothetical protein